MIAGDILDADVTLSSEVSAQVISKHDGLYFKSTLLILIYGTIQYQ